jgi:hypothetical protein
MCGRREPNRVWRENLGEKENVEGLDVEISAA